MSTQPQTQSAYTPEQYLEAGYHAELSGDHQRAAQYYHYLAEAFPDTREGDAARAGLARIGQSRSTVGPPRQQHPGVSPSQQSGKQAPARATTDPAAAPHGAASQPAKASAALAGSTTPGLGSAQSIRLSELSSTDFTTSPPPTHTEKETVPRANPGRPPPAHALAPAAETGQPGRDLDADNGLRLPEVVARRAREFAEIDEILQLEPRYRGGRLLAQMLSWFGWLGMAAGLALVLLSFIGIPAPLFGPNMGLSASVMIGVACVVCGIAFVLGGQVALATFDQAQSLREIGVILRARTDL